MESTRRLKNFIIVHGMNFLSLFTKAKKEMVDFHLAENRRAWGNYAPGLKYIEIQNKLTDIKYGQETPWLTKKISGGTPINAAFNSCEVIALFNALIALGIEKNTDSFPELLSLFERKGAVLRGYFGTAPKAIKKYLKSHNILIKKIAPLSENFGKTKVQILIYQNGAKITSGVHTICIVSENGKPRFLNGKPNEDSVPLLLWNLST